MDETSGSQPSGWRRFALKVLARLRMALAARRRLTPHDVGLGLAVGVFLGCAPLLPLQTAWAVGAAHLLRASKAAAFLGASISNPFTLAPLLAVYYRAGTWIAPELGRSGWPDFASSDSTALLGQGWDALAAVSLGGAAVGLPSALAAYGFGRWVADAWKRRRPPPGASTV